MSWREKSEEVIGLEIRAGFVARLPVAEIRRRVDAAYPFGPREYHPYKQWLRARRDLFAMHGLATAAEKARAKRTPDLPGQTTLHADLAAAQRDGLIRWGK